MDRRNGLATLDMEQLLTGNALEGIAVDPLLLK
jgi:hypothetical protein